MASTATDSLAAAALASGVTADGSGPASDAPSDIASFYRNRCVFITGATGFLGKVMVEKLLRCTDVHTIYLLVRSKGKQTAQERLEALLESDLFCRVRKERPNFAEKLVAVNGELTEPNMGLSPSDAEALAASVSIILHVAATIKFNERLKLAVKLNVIAVRNMLDFAKSLHECKAFIHISTAYAHVNREVIEEVVYPPFIEPQTLIDVTQRLDDDMAQALTPHLTVGRPNTYTFTKSIAEALVAQEGKGIPCAIVRPSIVGCSWRDPHQGHLDSYAGPSGLSLAMGSGVMRVMPGDPNCKSDVIPVDMVGNMTIAAAYYVGTRSVEKTGEPMVFNCTTSGVNPSTWGDWSQVCLSSWRQYPLEKRVFRRPNFSWTREGSYEYQLYKLVRHIVPGQLLDLFSRLRGQTPRMMRTYSKLEKAVNEYVYFTSHSWTWTNKNMEVLEKAMTPEDRDTFCFDPRAIDWARYIEGNVIGIKKYLLREDMSRVGVARDYQSRMKMVAIGLRTVLLAIILKFILPFLRRYNLTHSVWLLAPSIVMATRLL